MSEIFNNLCYHCGERFKPSKNGQKYCSNSCRSAAFRDKYKEELESKPEGKSKEDHEEQEELHRGIYLLISEVDSLKKEITKLLTENKKTADDVDELKSLVLKMYYQVIKNQ